MDIEVADAPAATDDTEDAAPDRPAWPERARRWPGQAREALATQPAVLAVVLAALVAVVGLLVRLWEANGRVPGWWNDTGAYYDVSKRSLLDGRFWAAERPPGVPLVLKIVQDPPSYRFMYVNIGAACIAWGWLTAEVVRTLRVMGLRAVAVAAALLGLSFTSVLILWDAQVLSESLALSLAAGTVAGVLRVVRVRTWPSVAILVVVAWLWTLMRDTNAVTILILAGVGALWLRRFAPPDLPRRIVGGAVVGLLLVAGWSMTSAYVGHRDVVPLADVMAIRVLGYPDRVEWFADHGMPQEAEILEAGKGIGPDAGTRLLELGKDDPKWAPWWRWLRSDGKRAWIGFVVTHPTFLFMEPLKEPERVYNNGDLKGYAGDMRVVPFVDDILWAPTALVLLGIGGLSFAHVRLRRRPTPLVLVAWTLVAAAGISAFATWHAGGMEPVRHLLTSAFELRLGLVLLALGVLLSPREATTEAA